MDQEHDKHEVTFLTSIGLSHLLAVWDSKMNLQALYILLNTLLPSWE